MNHIQLRPCDLNQATKLPLRGSGNQKKGNIHWILLPPHRRDQDDGKRKTAKISLYLALTTPSLFVKIL